MKLYNTKTRQLDELVPLDPSNIRIYTCGPTVYNVPHIGNYAAYIYWDLLVRTLKSTYGRDHVTRVLNLTDVGHLTSDGDEGEDKLEKGARREGKTVWEIADYYANIYLSDYDALHLEKPEVVARATDYIEPMMAAVDKMTENGFTYETTDGIYFDTAKFPAYADFARLDLENLKAGARVEYSSEKRNPSDFAVWKFIKPGENHAMRWDYLGRPGYPGWHLECSTIIAKELGTPIDIHTGGIDHIPVHHTNEIAQTFALTGGPLANIWLHCNFITIDNEKISKSLGNTYSLADLADRGFSPLDYKMWVLEGTFQGTRNFTFEALAGAKARRLAWRNQAALRWQSNGPKAVTFESFEFAQDLKRSLNNNLNSPEAFAKIDSYTALPEAGWKVVDTLFGLDILGSTPDISAEAKDLLAARAAARAEKNWPESDRLRAALEPLGLTVKDTPSGQIWQYLA